MQASWGPNMAAALDELQRRGYRVEVMAPAAVLDLLNRLAGSSIPESEHPEKAAALWLASLREVTTGNH